MVENSGKTAGPGPIRALNLPDPLTVEEDCRREPLAVLVGRRWLKIASVEDVWELADEWWRSAPISRRYYRVATEDGPGMTLFRDLLTGRWYRQRA